ncbi:278L [Invertebrate iridescent virus Kaz2018]|nr:278L [Invertebrate iridescent virus Kaz2018]
MFGIQKLMMLLTTIFASLMLLKHFSLLLEIQPFLINLQTIQPLLLLLRQQLLF